MFVLKVLDNPLGVPVVIAAGESRGVRGPGVGGTELAGRVAETGISVMEVTGPGETTICRR